MYKLSFPLTLLSVFHFLENIRWHTLHFVCKFYFWQHFSCGFSQCLCEMCGSLPKLVYLFYAWHMFTYLTTVLYLVLWTCSQQIHLQLRLSYLIVYTKGMWSYHYYIPPVWHIILVLCIRYFIHKPWYMIANSQPDYINNSDHAQKKTMQFILTINAISKV